MPAQTEAKTPGKWTLLGFNTLEEDDDPWYPIAGEHDTEKDAGNAARKCLEELEKTQPSATSGGQSALGIQDRIYIVSPDGQKRRIII